MVTLKEWYTGRTVLVTGGAGFLGKVLLEKMLRSLPGIVRIYVLLRPKRGMNASRRLQAMIETKAFDLVRQEAPDTFKKLVAIEGDLLEPELGLSPADRKRLQAEVSVVFHSAASLRLEAELRQAVQHNTMGTQKVLELCVGMPKLEAFIHLSTAFCHCEEKDLKEKVYPQLADPHDVIRLVNTFNDSILKDVTPGLLGQHPNCYTFSKRLTETLVDEYKNRMPVVIVRPSIVTSAIKEPLPGWVDTLNGPVGISVAGGKGVLRSMLCRTDCHAEVVPVDVVTNFMLVAAWDRGVNTSKATETPTHNVSVGDIYRITWGEVLNRGLRLVHDYPFENTVWYPDGSIRTNRVVHSLIVFFFQILPAYFIDFLMLLTFQKRFMVRVQKRISVGLEVLQYFTMREWNFDISNMKRLAGVLTEEERKTFYTSNVDFDVDVYFKDFLLGARQYCMKEPLSSLPRARIQLKIMYGVHILAKTLFYGFLLYFLIQNIEPAKELFDFCTSNLPRVPILRVFMN